MGSRRQFRPWPELEPRNLSHYAVTKLRSNAGRTESDVPIMFLLCSFSQFVTLAATRRRDHADVADRIVPVAWLKRLRKSARNLRFSTRESGSFTSEQSTLLWCGARNTLRPKLPMSVPEPPAIIDRIVSSGNRPAKLHGRQPKAEGIEVITPVRRCRTASRPPPRPSW